MMHNHMDDSQVSLDTHVRLRPLMGWWIRMVNKYAHFPWAASPVGDYVVRQLDLCNPRQLRLLIKFEARHKKRRALLDSLRSRILVDSIMGHQAVLKLTENVIAVKRDAVAIALHFHHTSELGEIMRVIAAEKEMAADLDASESTLFAFTTVLVRALRHCVCQAAKQDDRGQGVSTLQFALSKKSLQEAIDEGDIFDNPLARDQRSPAPARELEWAGMNTDTDTTNPSSTDPEALEEVVQSNEAVPPEDNDERSADIKESLVTNVQEIDQESSLDQIARMIEFAKVSVQDFGIARLREDAFTQHGENGTAVGAAIKAKITVRKASEQGLQNTEVGNLSTANTMACAFARQILTIDCDEGRVEPTVHHWLWGKQRTLPLPLQTTVGSRRQQRFQAALEVLLYMIHEIDFQSGKKMGAGAAVANAARKQIRMTNLATNLYQINMFERYSQLTVDHEEQFSLQAHLQTIDDGGVRDMMEMQTLNEEIEQAQAFEDNIEKMNDLMV
jgi:hypothetical protein